MIIRVEPTYQLFYTVYIEHVYWGGDMQSNFCNHDFVTSRTTSRCESITFWNVKLFNAKQPFAFVSYLSSLTACLLLTLDFFMNTHEVESGRLSAVGCSLLRSFMLFTVWPLTCSLHLFKDLIILYCTIFTLFS